MCSCQKVSASKTNGTPRNAGLNLHYVGQKPVNIRGAVTGNSTSSRICNRYGQSIRKTRYFFWPTGCSDLSDEYLLHAYGAAACILRTQGGSPSGTGHRFHSPATSTMLYSGPLWSAESALQFHSFDAGYIDNLCAGDHRTQDHFVGYFTALLQLKLRSRLSVAACDRRCAPGDLRAGLRRLAQGWRSAPAGEPWRLRQHSLQPCAL